MLLFVSWRAVQPTAKSHLGPAQRDDVKTLSCVKDQAASSCPPVAQTAAAPAATLFCWSVVHPSESTLLRAQWDLREGIFGCEDWRVFTNRSHAEAFAYLPVGRVLHVVLTEAARLAGLDTVQITHHAEHARTPALRGVLKNEILDVRTAYGEAPAPSACPRRRGTEAASPPLFRGWGAEQECVCADDANCVSCAGQTFAPSCGR